TSRIEDPACPIEGALAVEPARLLSGSGGGQPGAGSVDVAIARLSVVRAVVGVRPREPDRVRPDPALVERAVAIRQRDDRPGLAAEIAIRERQAEHDLDDLLGDEVA